MTYQWRREAADRWCLVPGLVSIRRVNGYWSTFVGNRALVGRFTSEAAARKDAWQFISENFANVMGDEPEMVQ